MTKGGLQARRALVKKTKVCEIFLDKNKISGIIPLLVLNYYNI